jgi:hypothetical protein
MFFFNFEFSKLGNFSWEKNGKNYANSKKNVNNKKIAKKLGLKI